MKHNARFGMPRGPPKRADVEDRLPTSTKDEDAAYEKTRKPEQKRRFSGEKKRRRRDSNPRDASAPNGFQNRRLQPLGHASRLAIHHARRLLSAAQLRRHSCPTVFPKEMGVSLYIHERNRLRPANRVSASDQGIRSADRVNGAWSVLRCHGSAFGGLPVLPFWTQC